MDESDWKYKAGWKFDGTPYEALELEKDADFATIKRSYKRLARIRHPDRNVDPEKVDPKREEEVKEGFQKFREPMISSLTMNLAKIMTVAPLITSGGKHTSTKEPRQGLVLRPKHHLLAPPKRGNAAVLARMLSGRTAPKAGAIVRLRRAFSPL